MGMHGLDRAFVDRSTGNVLWDLFTYYYWPAYGGEQDVNVCLKKKRATRRRPGALPDDI